MKLLLVKHSTSNHNPDQPAHEWGLTDEGIQRCHALAQHLAPYHPRRLFASTMPKARYTAAHVAESFDHIPIIENPRLGEHSRKTNAPYGTVDEFHTRIKQMFAQPDDHIYGDETANQARVRYSQEIADCLAQVEDDEHVIVVAHGTVNALFTAHHNPIDVYDLWMRLKLPSIIVLDLPTFTLDHVIEDAGIAP